MPDPNVVTCPLKAQMNPRQMIYSPDADAHPVEYVDLRVCDGERCAWWCAIDRECSIRQIARHLGDIAEHTLNLADIAVSMPPQSGSGASGTGNE